MSDQATLHRVSVGCMQTLISTAAEFLLRPVTAAELEDPAVATDAGAAVKAQFWTTRFDPVGAPYNAGSAYHDPALANRWRLRCYPIGTGAHVDRFVAWFNEAMRLTVAMATRHRSSRRCMAWLRRLAIGAYAVARLAVSWGVTRLHEREPSVIGYTIALKVANRAGFRHARDLAGRRHG